MSTFDDPNRESVGMPPIWTGADVAPGPTGAFDPGEHTVAEVEEYLAAHPDEAEVVLSAEASGKNRTTLTGG